MLHEKRCKHKTNHDYFLINFGSKTVIFLPYTVGMEKIRVRLFLLFALWVAVLDTSQCSAKELSAPQIAALIRPIEPLAMQYGTGDIKAYIFLDPKCPHSRDFLSMIHDNEKMRGIYRYYIFFYELKRLHSHNLIGSIYLSSSPLQQTLGVMVGEKEIQELKSFPAKVEERIALIDEVAEAIGVNKRPYLLLKKELD